MLATSQDLTRWDLEAEPLYEPGTTYCPECPELWPLDGHWYLVFSRFSEHAGTIYRIAEHPRGPFRVPANDELGGRRWYAAKSAPGSDGSSRIFFGWIHERTGDGQWCWGGDFAAPREVRTTSDGALQVRLPDAVRSIYQEPVLLDGSDIARIELQGTGSFASHFFVPSTLPASYLAHWTFSFNEAPAAFGIALRTDNNLAGWFVTFDRVRESVHLSRYPHALDDFWAELVGRGAQQRDVDGSLVAEARQDLPRHKDRVECSLLVEDSLVELYVDDRVALTHRILERGHIELGAFVVDGYVTCAVSARAHGVGVQKSRR
jgi:beta-fructofuranosidase